MGSKPTSNLKQSLSTPLTFETRFQNDICPTYRIRSQCVTVGKKPSA